MSERSKPTSERRERGGGLLDSARRQLAKFREHFGGKPKELDEAVGAYTRDAEAQLTDGSPEEIEVAEVAGLKIIENPSASSDTAIALDAMPIDSLGPALEAIELGNGPTAVATIIEAVDAQAHHLSTTDTLTEKPSTEASEQGVWEERSPEQNVTTFLEQYDQVYADKLQKAQEEAEAFFMASDTAEQWASANAATEAIRLFEAVPPRQLLQMRRDQGPSSLRFNELIGQVLSRCTDRNRSLRLDARLCGYDTVAEKYRYQQQTGKIDGYRLSAAETYSDLPETAGDSERKAFTTELLVDNLGYDDDAAAELIVAMSGRVAKNPTVEAQTRDLSIDSTKHYAELSRIASAVEAIGPENTKKLRETCGIVNIGELSPGQLQRMVRFADGDPALLEELQSKEVCVVLKDGTSDWNGAFAGMNYQYETNQDSTLIFEVSSSSRTSDQLKKHMQQLKEKGVRASVLVVAGHGAPGFVHIGNSLLTPRGVGEGEELPQKPGLEHTTLKDSGILDAIIDMKPDRDGNCTLLYQSCSQDGPIAGQEDNTTLVKAANEVSNAKTGKTFHILGIKKPGSMRRDHAGDIVDGRQQVSRLIIARSGAVYRHLTAQRPPQLPMFELPGTVRLKKYDDLKEVAA